MTTKQDDELPRVDVLELIDWQTQKNLAEIAVNSHKSAQALQKVALAAEKLPDVCKAIQRIDDTLARLADASEAFVSIFATTIGSAQTESGDACGFIQIAGPLGVRGGGR